MDPKHTLVFLVIAVYFLAEGTARTFFLQSEFRKKHPCMGGNLMKIHIASKGPSQAKCDGASTRDVNTRFSIIKIRGLRCFQFTDLQSNNVKYALKVKSGTNDVEFVKRACDNSIGSEFLFQKRKGNGVYKYMHQTMCLGISSNCADTKLRLFKGGTNDGRCAFKKMLKRN